MKTRALLFILILNFVSAAFASENLFSIVESASSRSLLDLTRAIRQGADVNQSGKNGENLLASAIVANGDRKIIQVLIDAGATLEPDLEWGVMSMVAGHRQDESLLRFLVGEGFRIDLEILKSAATNSSFRMFMAALELYGSQALRDEKGFSLLHSAANNGKCLETVLFLLRQGLGPNDRSGSGATPTMLAASNNPNPAIISTLIKAGGNLEERDKDGRTLLSRAILNNNNPEVAIALVNLGAKVNSKDIKGMTPLMHAVTSADNARLVQALIKRGAKVNTRDDQGLTSLMWACCNKNNHEIVELLLKAGADPNSATKNGISAIALAVHSISSQGAYRELRSVRMVELLLKYGAKLTQKNGMRHKIWLLAAGCEDGFPLVKKLLQMGVDINYCDPDDHGMTALMEAAVSNPDPAMVEFLLKHGAKIDSLSFIGSTALDYAAHYNNHRVVRLLLERQQPQQESCTKLLMTAAANPDSEVARLFLSRKAEVNYKDADGRTPLITAARFSSPEVVSLLVEAGSAIDHCDNFGYSALMAAAEMNVEPEIIRILIEAGANPCFMDLQEGKTALDFAMSNDFLKNSEVIEILRRLSD